MSRMATGMLKIVASESEPGRTILRLEGQVIGPWVEELKIASETALIHGAVVLDLGDVSFVERRGVELLQALGARGVDLVNCTSFVLEQLKAQRRP
jgi:hypothetical protein